MAYNFFLQQQASSNNLQNQITGISESIQNQAVGELANRQSQLLELSQESNIENDEEQSQLKQIKEAGLASIIEGGMLGIPGLKSVSDVAKQGYATLKNVYDKYNEVSDAVKNLKSTVFDAKNSIGETLTTAQTSANEAIQSGKNIADEALQGLKGSATDVLTGVGGSLNNTASSVYSSLSLDNIGAKLIDPLQRTYEGSSFDSIGSVFEKTSKGIMSPIDAEIQRQTQLLNQSREQFGDVINMTDRQLSNIPTPVLPTNPNANVIKETSFMGGEDIGSIGDVGANLAKGVISDAGNAVSSAVSGVSQTISGGIAEASGIADKATGAVAGGIADATNVVTEGIAGAGAVVAETTEKVGGLLGFFEKIGGSLLDVLDPIGAVATAALGVYSIVKGVESENTKAPPPQQTPTVAPVPNEIVEAGIQSQAQVGI